MRKVLFTILLAVVFMGGVIIGDIYAGQSSKETDGNSSERYMYMRAQKCDKDLLAFLVDVVENFNEIDSATSYWWQQRDDVEEHGITIRHYLIKRCQLPDVAENE